MGLIICGFSIIVLVIGIITAYFLGKAHQELNGDLKNLLFWIYSAVAFCGVPYVIWNFGLECNFIPLDGTIRDLPGMVLVGVFFIFMLMSALEAKQIAKKLGKKK